jgi:hypothetical protein
MSIPATFDDRAAGVEPRAPTIRALREREGALHERPDVGLQRLDVLGAQGLLKLGDQPLVGEVDVRHLDLHRLLVQERRQLLSRVVADRLVRVEKPGLREDADVPAVDRVARDLQRTLGQLLFAS